VVHPRRGTLLDPAAVLLLLSATRAGPLWSSAAASAPQ
jgi:hypothetical protein